MQGGAVGWEGADIPNLVAKLSVIKSAIERQARMCVLVLEIQGSILEVER